MGAFLALFLLLFLRFPCAFFFAFLALFIASITSLYPSGLLRNLFLRRGWSDQSVRQSPVARFCQHLDQGFHLHSLSQNHPVPHHYPQKVVLGIGLVPVPRYSQSSMS